MPAPYQFEAPTISAASVQALLAANRLEARPRSPEFNRALRAEIRDPTWLLARQWQMHEFKAEDRGTPACAEIAVRELPLSRLELPGQDARPYSPEQQPLEAAVEAQPRTLGAGLRLQMGQLWLRQLRAVSALAAAPSADRTAAMGIFARVFPLLSQSSAAAPVAYAQEATTPEVRALLELAGDAAVDGYALYRALLLPFAQAVDNALGDNEQLAQAIAALPLAQALLSSGLFTETATDPQLANGLAKLSIVSSDILNRQARQFVLTVHRLYLLGADNTSWSTEKMAYQFTVGTAGAEGLGANHYPGGASLPWYAVDQQPAPVGTPSLPALPAVRRLLPTEIQFPGAPNARWWAFEDRRVDFGQVTGDPSDWGRMLLQEFMFLYQNDWFSVPYSVPTGTVCAVESVRVTDVFGLRYALQPAGAGQVPEVTGGALIDNDANRWRLFAQTGPPQAGPATAPQLFVPAAALGPLVSQPVEQVSFRREEASNLVWAVESIISDGFAGGIDGATAAAQVTEVLQQLATPTLPDPGEPTVVPSAPSYSYQLVSTVPENWVPFVPIAEAGQLALEQGTLERSIPGLSLLGTDGTVQPRTALLQLHAAEPYRLHEHEVPPAGVRVEARCYRARWYGGRTIHWFGRQRGPAQPGGSSGLVFDQLQPVVNQA